MAAEEQLLTTRTIQPGTLVGADNYLVTNLRNIRGWRVGGAYNGSHHDIHVDHQAGDGRALTGRSVPGSLGRP